MEFRNHSCLKSNQTSDRPKAAAKYLIISPDVSEVDERIDRQCQP